MQLFVRFGSNLWLFHAVMDLQPLLSDPFLSTPEHHLQDAAGVLKPSNKHLLRTLLLEQGSATLGTRSTFGTG